MTSAALADCESAARDSASKAKTKRTVFIKVAPNSKERHPQGSDFNANEVIKYRPRMKDLRQPLFCRATTVEAACRRVTTIADLQRQSRSTRHHRRRFDLDPRGLLDETDHLDQRHGRIMRAENIAIDLPKRLQIRQILFHIDDIPGETNEVFGPGTPLRKNR